MVAISPKVEVSKDAITKRCERWKITEFALFGSILRDDFRPDSDVDVLVSFAPDAKWSLFDIVHMKEELETLFGREADLVQNEESKYHKWLQTHNWVFGLDYKLIESHKNLDDKRIPDFTGIRIHDNFRDIFEIKPLFIPLFQKDGAFTWEFNKAWNQVEEYLNFVIEDKDYLRRKELYFDNPECYLIIGYDLSEQQLRKIRTKARLNPAIKVRTYDDLIVWAEHTIKFVKKHKSRK